jgi:hypothetical protein
MQWKYLKLTVKAPQSFEMSLTICQPTESSAALL